jgi:tetratricopeptide (TPR) repeat protein
MGRLFRSSFLLILLASLLFSIAQNTCALERPAISHLAVSPPICEKTLNGIGLLYDLRFDEAEKLFQEVVSESPDRPAGYFYLAMVTWSRMVAGFWTPETVSEYSKRIKRTISVAEARIDNNVADSYDYLYLGGALGFMGRYNMMKGRWLSSFLVAKKAMVALNTCIKMDPNNRDVLLGIGTFDYYTARLSGVLKFLSYLLLHKGDRSEGLRKLHIAAEEAVYSATESKSLLLHIYLFFEQDCTKALPLARELSNRYNHDPTYKLFEGVACVRLELYADYLDTLLYMRRRAQEASSRNEALLWQRRALYLESIRDLFNSSYSEARTKLNEILKLSDPENDPAMIAWPVVKMGMTYDLEGDRKEARKYYQRILAMENGSGAQFMAEKCLDDPPEPKDPTIGY